MKSISERLKEKRTYLGLTAKQVVEELSKYGFSISHKTLYGYENGRDPDSDLFMALCKIYKINDILVEFGYGRLNENETAQTDLTIYAIDADDDANTVEPLNSGEVMDYLNEIASLPQDALGELRVIFDYLKFKYSGGAINGEKD